MLYEKLNPDMQRTVDEFTERIRPLPWSRKSDLLVEASQPFADQFEGDAARLASQGFLTAVIERLVPGEVDDPRQAVLFTLSLNAEHRALAERYLAAHPEVRELLEAEGADPDPGEP
ncbi:MAG TPA: hypothetical protein VF017_06495 [Thermoanaerobaculia bacterium]|nr:hypothetical protein [Thermoanaerobaculia bacterium]